MRRNLLLLLTISLSSAVLAQKEAGQARSFTEARPAGNINEPIYNGKEHIHYHPAIIGDAYYLSPDWQKGTVVFEDVPYKDAFLKYDLVADELVLRHVNGFQSLVLFTPRVQRFTLGERLFVNLSSGTELNLKPGYYELLASGKLSLYAKHVKLIEERTLTNAIERKFVAKDNFYVLKDGVFYPVRNEKGLVKLMGDQKAAVKSWFKASQIRFKDDPGAAFARMVDYYNQTNR